MSGCLVVSVYHCSLVILMSQPFLPSLTRTSTVIEIRDAAFRAFSGGTSHELSPIIPGIGDIDYYSEDVAGAGRAHTRSDRAQARGPTSRVFFRPPQLQCPLGVDHMSIRLCVGWRRRRHHHHYNIAFAVLKKPTIHDQLSRSHAPRQPRTPFSGMDGSLGRRIAHWGRW